MDNKNKFQFVDLEDISVKNNIEIVSSPEVVNVSDTPSKGEDNNEIEISNKKHFSFEARIIVSVIAILVLFIGACFLGIKVINHTASVKVPYVEDGDLSYQVCLKDATCEIEDITYNASDINIIKIRFKYDSKYERAIKYNGYYHISTILNSYNSDKSSKLYEKEIDIVDKTDISNTSNNFNIAETVTINYSKYKEMISEYNKDGNINQLEVVLYLEEGMETRKISSLVIPLTDGSFDVVKYNTKNSNRETEIKVNIWDTYSIIYTVFTSLLTLISLILIYRTTRLVLKVTNNNKNYYQLALEDILNEYDNLIVIARDGYESIESKEIVKFDSFKELLEVRNDINKPIIFSKINDVKCEFIVEDDEKLYKYVMKEADFLD